MRAPSFLMSRPRRPATRGRIPSTTDLRTREVGAAHRAVALALLLVTGCAGTADPDRLASLESLGGTARLQDVAAFAAVDEAHRAEQRALMEMLGADRGGGLPESIAADPDSIRARLGDARAILVYQLGTPHSSLWSINSDTWRRFDLPAAEEIAARIDTLRSMLENDALAGSPAVLRIARRLYVTLVEPAEPLLAGRREIVVVPGGALALLPFEALRTRGPERSGRLPGKGWLVQRWDVAYAWSAEAAAAERAPGIRGGVVALGDPLYDDLHAPEGGTTVAALPHTAMELAALDEEASGRDRRTLVGAHANRFRFETEPLVPDAGLLHLATHAVAVDEAPERSGFWLGADTTGHADFMPVAEIMGLELRANLVVLSQCETEAGSPATGRGMRALTGAFFAAGAEQVALSHWKPHDRATSLLIGRFYHDLLRRDFSAAAALAAAKRAMIRKRETRSPHLWAPLVLVEGEVRE